MKKTIHFLITACLLASLLTGCSIFHLGGMRHPVSCYYPRATFTYEGHDSVLLAEQKEASGHDSDLQYLMRMYLQGPVSAELLSPFPAGTQLLDVQIEEQTMILSLSREFLRLENSDLTLAGACLIKTAQGFADVNSLRILCKDPDGQNVEFFFRSSDFQF